MRKKFELIKTIQLLIMIAITAVALFVIFTDSALYQMVGRDPSVRALCILLWIALALSFVGVFWDFSTHSSFKKDYRELDFAVYNDRVSGIANRYSCDAMIEKYVDKPLPPNIGCVMLDLTNIREINDAYGHLKGNEAISQFSNMLHAASLGICFVGRNGGNKFMALFEECDETKINTFLTRVSQQIDTHNAQESTMRIEYRAGRAVSGEETVEAITQLIALSDRRLAAQTDSVTGFANRASCDDIISMYLDMKLPEDIGCVMLDIANIREINDSQGHIQGNRAIRMFGDALRAAAGKSCFVGRNGGTKFLALFEKCSDEKLDAFLGDLDRRMADYNKLENVPHIEYRSGRAFHEGEAVQTINQLVALSDRRMRGEC